MIPTEFTGRKLGDSEKKYPSMQIEVLAIYETITYLRNILLGRKFFLLTNAKALTYHYQLKKQPEIAARWLLKLQNYDFEVSHIAGGNNPEDFNSRSINSLTIADDLNKHLFTVNKNLNADNVKKEQLNYPKLKEIIEALQQKKK